MVKKATQAEITEQSGTLGYCRHLLQPIPALNRGVNQDLVLLVPSLQVKISKAGVWSSPASAPSPGFAPNPASAPNPAGGCGAAVGTDTGGQESHSRYQQHTLPWFCSSPRSQGCGATAVWRVAPHQGGWKPPKPSRNCVRGGWSGGTQDMCHEPLQTPPTSLNFTCPGFPLA